MDKKETEKKIKEISSPRTKTEKRMLDRYSKILDKNERDEGAHVRHYYLKKMHTLIGKEKEEYRTSQNVKLLKAKLKTEKQTKYPGYKSRMRMIKKGLLALEGKEKKGALSGGAEVELSHITGKWARGIKKGEKFYLKPNKPRTSMGIDDKAIYFGDEIHASRGMSPKLVRAKNEPLALIVMKGRYGNALRASPMGFNEAKVKNKILLKVKDKFEVKTPQGGVVVLETKPIGKVSFFSRAKRYYKKFYEKNKDEFKLKKLPSGRVAQTENNCFDIACKVADDLGYKKPVYKDLADNQYPRIYQNKKFLYIPSLGARDPKNPISEGALVIREGDAAYQQHVSIEHKGKEYGNYGGAPDQKILFKLPLTKKSEKGNWDGASIIPTDSLILPDERRTLPGKYVRDEPYEDLEGYRTFGFARKKKVSVKPHKRQLGKKTVKVKGYKKIVHTKKRGRL